MEQNSKFDEMKAKHPDWSDEQVWTAISIEMEADKTIEEGGKDINPNDPVLLRNIIEGAKKWLEEVLPVVFQKVQDFFMQVLDSVEVWARKGLNYLKDLIGNLTINKIPRV